MDALWEKVNEIMVHGCAHKQGHEKGIDELWVAIKEERKDREVMGEKLLAEFRSIRNQVVISVVLALALALALDKIIK